ncbi:hypothetical protein Pmar_PMAR026688 [Perkinsus marinus ATCC 50983]|uniref:Uncharacterized protein n=1 Tax=Perkinsus marinus (strain ATCC 50983 / TXsc) TaxID=423536 RepID=C5LWC2_PERM5|nr:hypothetical protein Pmar_PMAR026688 [Perkinsus marinus ATCC 50983]EEQ98964.1 hypothetical protein Pmar_PMAR026688 [Perkinsus marinus ATCC 50983]|eukprot:XP_002766247.1 hypothetical protein Pmar_PMAR026688 [Perkinsus marinus ATCC 50983]
MPTRNPRKFKERIYGSDEARDQAVASLQALLQDKLIGKPSTDCEYIVVEGSEATLTSAKTNGKINPEKACEELKRFLESRKGMCVHVHIKLPRCNLNDEEIIGILEVLVTHGKARLSSLESPGNNITDGLCDWLSREVEKSSGKMFSAVKEIDLSYNYLTAVGVGKLVKACPGLGHLDLMRRKGRMPVQQARIRRHQIRVVILRSRREHPWAVLDSPRVTLLLSPNHNCVGGSEQTVADLLDTLKKFLETHKAESAATSGEEPAGQPQTAEAYGSDAKEEQRMTMEEMEANLFNSLRKDDQMVSIHGDRESVEGVTEEVTELITVLAKRVRDEKTSKEAATQAAAEFKAAVLARANAGIHSVGVAKQEPTATEYESSPASPEDLRGDEAVSSNEMNSEKVGMERDRKQTNRLGRNDDAADDFEGSAEFISAKESEAGSM